MLSPLPRRSGWAYSFAHSPQPYQPSPKGLSGRPAHRPFRGLLSVYSRYGLHTRAVTVYRDTLTRGFSHFVTSMTAPVASGWSDCRVGLAPTGKRRLCTAHPLTTDVVSPAPTGPFHAKNGNEEFGAGISAESYRLAHRRGRRSLAADPP